MYHFNDNNLQNLILTTYFKFRNTFVFNITKNIFKKCKLRSTKQITEVKNLIPNFMLNSCL